MSISLNSLMKAVLIYGIVAIIALAFSQSIVECARETNQMDYEDSVADYKRLKEAYKIIRTYLQFQIDELDQMYQRDDSNDRILNAIVERRQLKTQGFMERYKNKMENDINKYGWDK